MDTNFINFAIKNKVTRDHPMSSPLQRRSQSPRTAVTCAMVLPQIDLVQGMMDCLYATCIPCITDCVLAELEKLGQKYRVALRVAKVRPHRVRLCQDGHHPCAGMSTYAACKMFCGQVATPPLLLHAPQFVVHTLTYREALSSF